MAIIYGRAETEKDLLSNFPKSINKFEDIDTAHQGLKDHLNNEKKDFSEKLPNKIKEEEEALEKIKNDKNITIQNFDEKIKNLEKEKTKGGFSSISAPIKISFVKNFSKRRKLNQIKNLQEKQQKQLSEWKENPDGIFNKLQSNTIQDIKYFDKIKQSPIHAGAKGEIQALKNYQS